MTRTWQVWCLVVVVGCGVGPVPGDPVVEVESGLLRGIQVEGAQAFLGVPYASPPVLELRYAAPRPVTPWTGERAVQRLASPCPQYPSARVNGTPEYVGDEDCLHLNVWTPADRLPGERLAVMVFLHGGGNFTGSSAEPMSAVVNVSDGGIIYDGAALAAAGRVVVVVPNYRLGVLGFLAHTVVGGTTGNFGLLDQQAALAWVQRNVEAFGGDPDRVLLFGQSGGAYDVCMHLTSPGSAGLFSRAAMHSGVCYAHPLAVMEGHTRSFISDMGCAGEPDVLGCLKGIADPEVMVKAPSAIPGALASFTLHPYIDGQVVPAMPYTRITTGQHTRVPFIIGSNSEEYAFRFESTTDANYVQVLASSVGLDTGSPELSRVLQLYPRGSYGSARELVVDAVSDRNITCSSRAIARAVAAAQGEPVYRYHFRQRLDSPVALAAGAYHTLELTYLFQHMGDGTLRAGDADRAVERHLLGYWTRFAATGSPSGGGAQVWPAFMPSSGEQFLVVRPEPAVEADLKAAVCDFWDSLAP